MTRMREVRRIRQQRKIAERSLVGRKGRRRGVKDTVRLDEGWMTGGRRVIWGGRVWGLGWSPVHALLHAALHQVAAAVSCA